MELDVGDSRGSTNVQEILSSMEVRGTQIMACALDNGSSGELPHDVRIIVYS